MLIDRAPGCPGPASAVSPIALNPVNPKLIPSRRTTAGSRAIARFGPAPTVRKPASRSSETVETSDASP